MPYFALVILVLFVAIVICGAVGAARHYFPGKPKQAPTDPAPGQQPR